MCNESFAIVGTAPTIAGQKAKKRKIKLENRQRWYDNQNQAYQKANKRPGSVKLK